MEEITLATDGARVPQEALNTYREKLSPYRESLENKAGKARNPHSFLHLPEDAAVLEHAKEAYQALASDALRFIILIGAGGSSLGAQAVYRALTGTDGSLGEGRTPQLLAVDSLDPALLKKITDFLIQEISSPEEIIIHIASKSGETTETIANAEVILSSLKGIFSEIEKQVAVTTVEGSPLWKWAKQSGGTSIAAPGHVGGRYSVFTATGLFPLVCTGIDAEELLAGARSGTEIALREYGNMAADSASIIFHHATEGRGIYNTFLFHGALADFGAWQLQIIAESIGKGRDRGGNILKTGITPIVSMGPKDLHSIGELYLGGVNDKLHTFISVKNFSGDARIGSQRELEGLNPELSGKDASFVLNSILNGVEGAYRQSGIPFMHLELPEVSAYTLGEVMQVKMIEILYLARLLNVDPFTQPGVEAYKTKTKQILKTGGV